MSDANAFAESDPRQALRMLIARGAGNSPDAIMLRLLWLRQEHPGASISTEAIRLEDNTVVLRAAISLQNGAAGSGIAASRVEVDDDWAAIVERTETRAISRALDTLGYVVAAAVGQRASATTPPDLPERRTDEEKVSLSTPAVPERPSQAEAGAGVSENAARSRVDEVAPPVVSALRRANRRTEPTQFPTSAASDKDDTVMAEYSWSAFWSRARELGLTKDRVTEALGRPAHQTTPKEAVAGLIGAGLWPETDEG